MDGGQRAVVTGVHRLEHVQGFATTALSDDDAIGSHAQRVDDQFANGDPALAVDVRRTSLEAADVLLVSCSSAASSMVTDAFVDRDEPGAHVEEGRLTGTGSAGHQMLARASTHAWMKAADSWVSVPKPMRSETWYGSLLNLRIVRIGPSSATGESPRSRGIRRGGGRPWSGVPRVDAAADRGTDRVDHAHEMRLIVEADIGEKDLALAFHVDHLRSVDHDFSQAVVVDEWTQWTESLEIPAVELLRDGCHAHVRMLLGFRTEGGSAPIVCATA